MVYDSFLLYDEMDILEIRLNILDSVVDKFVITEANTTFMGQKKDLNFEKNKERFAKFQDKIIYNVLDIQNVPFENQWLREQYCKNHVLDGVEQAQPEDIILYSDIDEIPNPEKIRELLKDFNQENVYHFAQRMFYFFINYEERDGKLLAACGDFDTVEKKQWIGTRMCTVKKAREITLDGLRNLKLNTTDASRVSNGGWHFSYMGGNGTKVKERVKAKLGAFSHSEYNKPKFYAHIYWKILTGKDFLGRDCRFHRVKIDETYPKWLRDHYKEYKHLYF